MRFELFLSIIIIKFLFYFMFCWERKTKGERFDLLGHEEFIFYVFYFYTFLYNSLASFPLFSFLSSFFRLIFGYIFFLLLYIYIYISFSKAFVFLIFWLCFWPPIYREYDLLWFLNKILSIHSKMSSLDILGIRQNRNPSTPLLILLHKNTQK